MNKTGSSSIQATARHGADLLRDDHGLDYYTGLKSHSLIAGLFMADPVQYAAIVRQVGFRKDVVEAWAVAEYARFDAAIRDGTAPTFMISGEGLSAMAPAEIARLRDFLLARFVVVDVFLYLRDPFSYALSKAQQNVRSGVTFDQMRVANLSEPVMGPRSDGGRFSPALQPFYRQRIEPYQQAFGAGRVHLRRFDPPAFPDGNVVRDFFLWAAGLDLKSTRIRVLRINDALDNRAIELLEMVNRTTPPFLDGGKNPDRAASLAAVLNTSDGPAFVFPAFDFDRFAEVIAADVAWLRDATDHAIDFGPALRDRPDRTPLPPSAPQALAKALNARLLVADNDKARADLLERLLRWHVAERTSDDAVPGPLSAALDACNDPAFLSRLLRMAGPVVPPRFIRNVQDRLDHLHRIRSAIRQTGID